MRINNVFGLLSVVLIWSFCLNGMGIGGGNSSNGIYMKVSGKVIQKETGQGVQGVIVDIININTGDSYDCTTDINGNFVIKMVPQGIYEISDVDIHMTCPEELIIDEIPETIMVTTGRNIYDLNIYLQKGATISGYVYEADGVTPVEGVDIASYPCIYLKNESVYTNEQGKYVIKGVGQGKKLIRTSAAGFADESIELDVLPGSTYENKNFILGRGKLWVKGKITSSGDNQPIKNALVFFIYFNTDERYSAGWAKTDENGEYYITGLKNPGTFELSIGHEEYVIIDAELIQLEIGENNKDYSLEKLSVQSGMRVFQEAFKSAEGGGEASNTINCCSYNFDFDQIQNQACQDLQQNKDCIKYLRADEIKDCLECRCGHKNYKIQCVKRCKENTCGYVVRVNLKCTTYTKIRICMNNSSACNFETQLPRIIVHELYHICDRNSSSGMVPCLEYRAYRDTFCMYHQYSDWANMVKFGKVCKDLIERKF
jgi:protocatechuate 3,4-dioxygenase beta subunit